MADYILLAMTNPAEGREDDYNAWMDDHHIPEVLAVPGFVSAQRFELTEDQRTPPPHPYRYAAQYEIETDNLSETLAALGQAVQNGTKSDAGDPSRRALWVFRPRGEKRTA